MSKSDCESDTSTNISGSDKGPSGDFPLSQWQATSGPNCSPSGPQTFDAIQNYFSGSKEKSSHNLGDELSTSAPFEAIEFSDINHMESEGHLHIPQLYTENFTENKAKMCPVSDSKISFESLHSLFMLPDFDDDQTSNDTDYNEIECSKRPQSCVDSLKAQEKNSTEKNTSFCAKIPGGLLRPNIKLYLTKFEKTCLKLIPLINQTNPRNYSVVLVETLRTCSQDITLKEFYNLLYNSNTLAPVNSKPLHESKMNQYENKLKLEGLNVCSFVLDTFSSKSRRIDSMVMQFVKNPLLEVVNLEEVRKKFLAIKILFDCVLIDESSLTNRAVPRTALYKAYCMICKKFPERVNLYPEHSKLKKSGFVGAPHFGTLTKLVYPHIKLRRLGKRGNSKHHYVGIMWNKSIVDAEMLKCLESNKRVTLRGDTQKKSQDIPKSVSTKIPASLNPDGKRSFFSGFADTKYSFVLLATKLPNCQFSPRVWKYFSGKLPQQSHWSWKIMAKSSMALQKYDIDMTPVIHEFHADIFSSDESKIFLGKFIQRINILIENNSDDEGYFHMYLIILLLIFPVILATDKEVPCEDKVKLRKRLKDFVHGLDFEIANFPTSKLNYLQNFSNIIKKMIHINELSSSHIKTGLVQAIVQEIALDIQKPTASHMKMHESSAIEEIFSRAVFAAANAFKSEFVAGNTQNNVLDNSEILGHILKAFMNCAIKTTEHLLRIPRLMSSREIEISTFDLPFQIFRISTTALHEICFSDPFISKLSIHVIGYILLMVTNELQNVSFRDFGNRESELSQSTFKTWWVLSVLIGEYMKILEEIVALSERLA